MGNYHKFACPLGKGVLDPRMTQVLVVFLVKENAREAVPRASGKK